MSKWVWGLVAAGIAVVVALLAVAGTLGPDRRIDRAEHRLGDPETVALVARAEAIVLGVAADTCAGRISGSGFVVGDRWITNRHVVEGAPFALLSGGGSSEAATAAISQRAAGLDLAAGPFTADVGTVPARLAGRDAEVGEVVVMAARIDGRASWRQGRVHLYTDGTAYGIDGEVMLIDEASTVGFSGGPVLNRRGEVVGVLTAVDLTTSLTIVIPRSELDAWLRNSKRDEAVPGCIDATAPGALSG